MNRILVIGGGTVGVELAAELCEHFPSKEIVIVHSGEHLLNRNNTPTRAVQHATTFLTSRGVKLILSERVVAQRGSNSSRLCADTKRAQYFHHQCWNRDYCRHGFFVYWYQTKQRNDAGILSRQNKRIRIHSSESTLASTWLSTHLCMW